MYTNEHTTIIPVSLAPCEKCELMVLIEIKRLVRKLPELHANLIEHGLLKQDTSKAKHLDHTCNSFTCLI